MKEDLLPFEEFYQHRCKREGTGKKRPLIGITGNYGEYGCQLAQGYYQSVYEAGGTPVVIPPLTGDEDIESLLNGIDGIIFSGGGDVNPLLVGEEPIPQLHDICPQRDVKELLMMQMALDRQLPMLCICRGIQLLSIVKKGKVIQDLGCCEDFKGKLIKHSQNLERSYASHSVILSEGTKLHDIFRKDELWVNSFHHQAVSLAGENMAVAAISKDGVIEAIEDIEAERQVIGVQWHPECFILRGDRSMMPLFKWHVGESKLHARAKELHRQIISLDTHSDTPMKMEHGADFFQRDENILIDLHKMEEGSLDAAIMVAYIPQGELTDEAHAKATAYCNSQLDLIDKLEGEYVGLAITPQDLVHLKHEGRKIVMKGIENGYAIGNDINNLKKFRDRGVVYLTLCHNGDNLICDSAKKSVVRNGGVSQFGEKVIKEMNSLGMMVDLSHAAEKSFWDALDISETPIVCSHASCKSLCNHPRNFTDLQLQALARVGGVCQITLYPYFLKENGEATILDAIDHLNHAVDIAGIDCVGLGTDFDGDGGVPGLADASQAICFTRQLLRKRFSDEDIRKIWGGNFLRVMNQVIDKSQKQ